MSNELGYFSGAAPAESTTAPTQTVGYAHSGVNDHYLADTDQVINLLRIRAFSAISVAGEVRVSAIRNSDLLVEFSQVITIPSGAVNNTITEQVVDWQLTAGETYRLLAADEVGSTEITYNGDAINNAMASGSNFEQGNTYNFIGTSLNVSMHLAADVVTADSAPVIVSQPSDISVQEDSQGSVNFIAAASGGPTPTVQWEKDTQGNGIFADVLGETSETISIQGTTVTVAANDGDVYRAVFTNTQGAATTDPATLTVTAAGGGVTTNIDIDFSNNVSNPSAGYNTVDDFGTVGEIVADLNDNGGSPTGISLSNNIACSATSSSGLTDQDNHGIPEGVWDRWWFQAAATASGIMSFTFKNMPVGSAYSIDIAGATNNAGRDVSFSDGNDTELYANPGGSVPITPTVPVNISGIVPGNGEVTITSTITLTTTYLTVARLSITQAAPQVDDVDGDNDVTPGQDVFVNGNLLGSDSGSVAMNGVAQTLRPTWSDSAVPITITQGNNKYGTHPLVLTTSGATETPPINVLLSTVASLSAIDLLQPLVDKIYRLDVGQTFDVENNDQIEYTNLSGQVTVNNDGSIVLDSGISFPVSIIWRVWDSSDETWGTNGLLTVIEAPAPVFTGNIEDQATQQNQSINLDISGNWSNSPTAYAVTSGQLPAGVSLSNAGVITGTFTTIESLSGIVITASSIAGGAVSNSFTWDVTEASTVAPTFSGNISNQTGSVNGAVNINISGNWINGPVSYAVTSGQLPAGLSLSNAGVISGTLTTVQNLTGIVITATNSAGSAPSNAFSWTVAGVEVAPVFTGNIAAQTQEVGANINLDVSSNWNNNPTAFVVSAGQLPAGLSISNAGVITGILGSIQSLTGIIITGSNTAGSAISNAFDWTVTSATTTKTATVTGVVDASGASITRTYSFWYLTLDDIDLNVSNGNLVNRVAFGTALQIVSGTGSVSAPGATAGVRYTMVAWNPGAITNGHVEYFRDVNVIVTEV